MDDSRIRQLLAPYGIVADSQLCRRTRKYIDLLLAWNKKISLTTIIEPDEIVRFHFGESLFAIKGGHVEKSRLADVGTGGGFPGLPLAMALPELEVTLIEANSKKAAFLGEIIRTLAINNVFVRRERMENLGDSFGDFDFVVARALGEYGDLARWAKNHLTPSGRLILWIGDDDAAQISRVAGWNWTAPLRIPHSRNRALLVGFPRT